MEPGIIVIGVRDRAIESGAKRAKLDVQYSDAPVLAFDKTLIVASGTRVPWGLLPAAWHFLERWDAAVPLWRYGVLAADVGTKEERARTQAVVRDLRVLLHSVELLFVRDSEDGRALIAAYNEELAGGGERRLAFLRAYYRTKPRMCVLPRTWLAEVQARAARGVKPSSTVKPPQKLIDLVRVEIAPGRFVKCMAGEEERVREEFQRRSGAMRRAGLKKQRGGGGAGTGQRGLDQG